MYRRNTRSAKLLKLIPEFEASKNIRTPGQSEKQKPINDLNTHRKLRPRHIWPSYATTQPNASTDESFMDSSIENEKNRDKTYVPDTDDDTANSSYLSNCLITSITTQDISYGTKDSFLDSIPSDLQGNETGMIDQVAAGNITIGQSENILADASDDSVIGSSDTSKIGQHNTYIPPSESEESYVTDNHPVTRQVLPPIQANDSSNTLERFQCDDNVHIPPNENEKSYLSEKHSITSQSLSLSHATVPPMMSEVSQYNNYSSIERVNTHIPNDYTTSQSLSPNPPNTLNLFQYYDSVDPLKKYNKPYLTQTHTITSQSLSRSHTTVPPITYEMSQYHNDPWIGSVNTKEYTVTSQSLGLSQTTVSTTQDKALTTSTYIDDNDDHNSYVSQSSENSEFDESDRDETYKPTCSDSSSTTSYTEDIPIIDSACETRHSYSESSQETTRNTEEILPTNEPKKKMKRIRTKDYCFFCETDVLNFARHITRNHSMEIEVQRILSYPKKSLTRKNILTSLRKKGNYIKNATQCFKPMKKSNLYPDIDYLPCEYCLGFYSRKQLWKHKKKCQPTSKTANTQVEAQNFMLRNLKVDKKLKEEVFPKMRPDKTSLEAKKDSLICAFGAQYLRIHREKHFANVTSRKMRELAKLLIEMKKLKPSIKDLMDSLKPQNYDLIVTATKKVSSYDDKTDRYGAPTYAMNISTSLKQCCNIAIMTTLKSDSSVKTATIEADLKTLIHLIESNWKFDVSSQANSDLNMKKWNKITIVPLASDLKLLKSYLCEKSKSAASKLLESENSNMEAYTTLMETVYCRILLLNRRRPGELQRLLLSTYQECHIENNAYEEFDRAISNAEKILLQSFKRIVIRGKRGRGVPVLLTDEVQNDIDLLISVRRKYVSDKNHFLFAKPGSENTLCGYKVLEKYANACGAKNPKAITTTKLRKHLATLTQMFNLKETDIEQLANFMGHTQAVHRQNYRLPDDVYQTAKLSKLLLLMESGDADCYKGKSLDDIDLDLEQDLLQDTREADDEIDDIVEYEAIIPTEERIEKDTTDNVKESVNTPKSSQLCDITNAVDPRTKKKRNLVPWTPQQKNIVKKFFSKHIKNKQPPKRHECDELRDLHPEVLYNKDWLKIKVFVQNIYTKGNK